MISAKTGIGIDEVLEAIVDRLPPPQGRRRGAAAGAGGRFPVRRLSRRRRLVRVIDGTLKKGQKIRLMGTGADASGRRGGRAHAQGAAVDRAGAGRSRLHHRRDQGDRGRPGRRHHHRRPQARGRRRCPASAEQAGRVLRHLPDRRRRLRQPARQPGQAAAQRRQLRVRAGEQLGALGFGFRCGFLGLLHSRSSRSGSSASTTSTSSHRALGGLPRPPERRRRSGAPQPGRLPDPIDRPRRGAVDQGHIMVPESYLGGVMQLCRERRGVHTS